MEFLDCLDTAANEFGIALTDKQLQSFDQYYRLLIAWNNNVNLTAITEPQAVAIKHMVDSLTCFDPLVFKAGLRVIDVGTGAGFPAIPLKILYPELDIVLLDSLKKRLNFLEAVIAALNLKNIQCVHARAEDAAHNKQYREKCAVAVSRAVAPLNILAEYCLPFVKVNGWFVALKGAQCRDEAQSASAAIKQLGGQLQQIKTIKLPVIEDQRGIVYIKKVVNTPAGFPRRSGTPEKKPLT